MIHKFKRPNNIVEKNSIDILIKEFFDEYVNTKKYYDGVKYKINSDKTISCTGKGTIFFDKSFVNFYIEKYGYFIFDNLIPFKFKQVGCRMILKSLDFTEKDFNNLPLKINEIKFENLNKIYFLPKKINKLSIYKCSLKSFENLTQVPEYIKTLDLEDNENLTSLKGLSNTDILNYIRIVDCPIKTFKDGPRQCESMGLFGTNLSLEEIKKIPDYINIIGHYYKNSDPYPAAANIDQSNTNGIKLTNNQFISLTNWQPEWYRNRFKNVNESINFERPKHIVKDNIDLYRAHEYINEIKTNILGFKLYSSTVSNKIFDLFDRYFKYYSYDDVSDTTDTIAICKEIQNDLDEVDDEGNDVNVWLCNGFWVIGNSIIALAEDSYDSSGERLFKYYDDILDGDEIFESFKKPNDIVKNSIKYNIVEYLKKYGINDFNIDSNNNIEVKKGKLIFNKNENFPYKFNEVISFEIANSPLTKIPETCPEYVSKNFKWTDGYLVNLENAPNYIGILFDVSNNKLKSLKGIPSIINGTCDLSNNSLRTLDNYLITVYEDLHLEGNNLLSLDGMPFVGYDLYIDSYFDREEIDKIRHKVKGEIHLVN